MKDRVREKREERGQNERERERELDLIFWALWSHRPAEAHSLFTAKKPIRWQHFLNLTTKRTSESTQVQRRKIIYESTQQVALDSLT